MRLVGRNNSLLSENSKNWSIRPGPNLHNNSIVRETLEKQSVKALSCVRLFVTPWTAACQVSLSVTNSWVYSNPCPLSRWCHPTISSSVVPFSSHLQFFPASGSFQWVSSLHQVAKVWSFSFSINPSNEYSGLISFRMDWLDLFAVQETLKSKQSFLFSLKCVIWQVNEIYPFCKTFRHSINVCVRHLWNENFKCRIHCFIIIYS